MIRLRSIALAVSALVLSGCKAVVLQPSGDVAIQQKDTLLASVWLMLIVIIPVMAMTVFFAWKYRASNKNNTEQDYAPEWDHSTRLELVIWSAPLLIIIALGALTWLGTHLLDPYRPISRISEKQMLAANVKPLEVDAVALDWKWLFIYPQYNMATVNELAAPVDRPIDFHITASSVMNAFYIPALAGQIYAMPGMQTRLEAVINKAGVYKGISSNYSGAGFSGMHFKFYGQTNSDFAAWVAKVKARGTDLSRTAYLALAQPSENTPPTYYKTFAPGLYKAILYRCVIPGKMCMDQMMAIDAKGGTGEEGAHNIMPAHDTAYTEQPSALGPVKTFVRSLPENHTMGHMQMGKHMHMQATAPNPLTQSEADYAAGEAADMHTLAGAGLPQPHIVQTK